MRKLRLIRSIRGLTNSIKKREWYILFFALVFVFCTIIFEKLILSPWVEKFYQKRGWNYGWVIRKTVAYLSLSIVIFLILIPILLINYVISKPRIKN